MPDDSYAYDINQRDVPKERRSALQRYHARRRLWLTWLHTDEHHAIWPTLHTMVAELEAAYILIHQKKLSSLQPLVPILESIVQAGKPLLIVPEDIEGEAWRHYCRRCTARLSRA